MTVTATFRDGPLAGTSVEVDLEKHDWHDRKTGAHYVRLTEYTAGNVVSYFVLRETAYAQTQNETTHAKPVRRYYLRSVAEIQEGVPAANAPDCSANAPANPAP